MSWSRHDGEASHRNLYVCDPYRVWHKWNAGRNHIERSTSVECQTGRSYPMTNLKRRRARRSSRWASPSVLLTHPPRWGMDVESNRTDSRVGRHSTTTCTYRRNISMPIQEISSYSMLSIRANAPVTIDRKKKHDKAQWERRRSKRLTLQMNFSNRYRRRVMNNAM